MPGSIVEKKNVKLSIITINLNNTLGLKKTIESVIGQIYNDFELLIIDGKSSDSSLDIIKQYSDSIAYWISEPDRGIYHAMNKGIKKAKGEYCFFLNSGDYYFDCNTLQAVFQKNPTEDILFGNLKVVNPDKSIDTIYGKPIISFLDLYKSNVVKHQSAFIKTKLFHQYGYYYENNKIVSDWEFFMKVLGFNNASYRYVDINIAYFDNNGISNHSNEVCEKEKESILKREIVPLMLADYQKWSDLAYLEPALNQKWSEFLLRIVCKIAKEFQKLKSKR